MIVFHNPIKKYLIKIIFIFTGILLISPSLYSSHLQQELEHPFNQLNTQFGFRLATNNGRLFVGAIDSEHGMINSGAVFMYERNIDDWIYIDQILPPDSIDDMHFGSAILATDNFLFIGAFDDTPISYKTGSVYVYENVNGQLAFKQKISPNMTLAEAKFGFELAYSNGTLMVGATEDINNSIASGSVYEYQLINNNFEFSNKMSASDASDGSKFGQSIYFQNNELIIGAPYDNHLNTVGSVFVYSKNNNGWVRTQKLMASMQYSRAFGYDIDKLNNLLVIGSPFVSQTNSNNEYFGKVYKYELEDDIWHEANVFLPPAYLLSMFGYSVKFNKNRLYAVSRTENGSFGAPGAAVFEYEQKNQYHEFNKRFSYYTIERDERFGLSLETDDELIVIGAPNKPSGTINSGKVYSFLKTYEITVKIQGLYPGNKVTIKASNEEYEVTYTSNYETKFINFFLNEPYYFDIIEQPTNPNQNCQFDNNSGTITLNEIYLTLSCEHIDLIFETGFE